MTGGGWRRQRSIRHCHRLSASWSSRNGCGVAYGRDGRLKTAHARGRSGDLRRRRYSSRTVSHVVSHTVKRVAKCGSSLEALGRIFGDGHQDNLIERGRKFGLKFDGWPRRLDHVSGHNGIVAALREGALAGHHFIKADAN